MFLTEVDSISFVWISFSHSYLAKLSEQLDEGTFTKGVGEAGVESQRGVFLGEHSHPALLLPRFREDKKKTENRARR